MANIVLVSCEHGGNRIPAAYSGLFNGWEAVLDTHRGFDRGALTMARDLADAFHTPLMASTVSRLLIDLNRSLSNPSVWSEVTRTLSRAAKLDIVQRYYVPYREKLEKSVRAEVTKGHQVIHVSSHSFTPVLNGEVRTADIGLLYHPARAGEATLAARWRAALIAQHPPLRVRRNYPYLGKNDGLVTWLRHHFPPDSYIGIELEINQAWVLAGRSSWRRIRQLVITALRSSLHQQEIS